jgi:hypothetical protein
MVGAHLGKPTPEVQGDIQHSQATRTTTMPPHILKSRILKNEIDEKANIIEMNDAADEDNGFDDQDEAEPRDRPNNQPDLCFDADPDESCYSSRDDDDGGAFGDSGEKGCCFGSGSVIELSVQSERGIFH